MGQSRRYTCYAARPHFLFLCVFQSTPEVLGCMTQTDRGRRIAFALAACTYPVAHSFEGRVAAGGSLPKDKQGLKLRGNALAIPARCGHVGCRHCFQLPCDSDAVGLLHHSLQKSTQQRASRSAVAARASRYRRREQPRTRKNGLRHSPSAWSQQRRHEGR